MIMCFKNSSPLLFAVLLFLSCSNKLASQEPFNTDLRFSNISRNPAITGLQDADLAISISYQPQNQSILIPYKALQVQIESQFRRKESLDGFSIAALIRYDEAGINQLKRAQFLPVLNFHKSLSDVRVSVLSMAFMPGIFKSQFDQSILPNAKNFHPIPFNPSSPVPQFLASNSSTYFDFSTGISFYERINDQIAFYLGAALFHFGQNTLIQNQGISKMPREWVLNSGLILTRDQYSLQFLGDLRIHQTEKNYYIGCIWGIPISKDFLGQCTELNFGTYYNHKQELSPIVALKMPNLLLSFTHSFYIGATKQIPFLPCAVECNLAIGINCHRRTIESEKMKCTNGWYQ